MLKSSDFPDKVFTTKDELFAELKTNETRLIEMRKVEKFAPSVALDFRGRNAVKFDMQEGFIYPVINTTNYMDSHNDVHVSGLWNKSVQEQKGNVYYVADHDLSLKSVIAFKEDVEMMLVDTTFKDLGFELEGNTQALIFKVAKDKIQLPQAKNVIEKKIDIQHSVRMRYIDIKLAINSTNPDYAENKAAFDQYLPIIANKEKVIEQGYFYAVTTAAVSKEGSMVLFGSNDITPLFQKEEPLKSTPNNEPLKSTQEKTKSYYDF